MHAASIRVIVAALLMAGCGASEPPPPERPRGAASLLDRARRCEREAAEHEAMAGRPESRVPLDSCVSPIDDVSTTGGKPLVVRRPCWTGLIRPDVQHRREAARLREQAARYRARAAALLRMERQACAGPDHDTARAERAHDTCAPLPERTPDERTPADTSGDEPEDGAAPPVTSC